jgi:VWFA-related protein
MLLPFIVLAASAGAQAPIEDRDELPYRISLNVDLVVLPVTVRDRKGVFASGLGEPDFQVYEDGIRQSIRLFRHEDIPVTVGLVVDHSASMKNKLPEVAAAARTFVRASNRDDQMFVVNFNEKVSVGLPATVPFSDRAEDLEAAIGKIPAAGQTALYDAIGEGLDRLKTGERERKALIVISDGGDNASLLNLSRVLKKAGESNAVVYTIGIFDADDEDRNPDVLRRLARATGGEAFFPGQLDEVVAICERIASDIRHQYTIGYVSANTAKVGGYRAVRVVAQAAGRDLVVHTRAGYIAAGASVKNEGAK